jgi:hypothetical protein
MALVACGDDRPPQAADHSASADSEWLLLDAAAWSIRKSSDHYEMPAPFKGYWFVEYQSRPSPNQDLALVLSAAHGDREEMESFARVDPANSVAPLRVHAHDGLRLETHYTEGGTAGSWLLWQQTPSVWIAFGSSEMSFEELEKLSTQIVDVDQATWRDRTTSAAPNS